MEKAAGGGERKGKEREVTAAAICGRRGATRRNPPIKWDAWRLLIVTAARWHHRSAPITNAVENVALPGAAGLWAGWPELVWPESDTGGDGLATDLGISEEGNK